MHGIKRGASSFNADHIDHLYQDPHVNHWDLILHYSDLTDTSNLVCIIQECQPNEVYHLGTQIHLVVSFESPEYKAEVDAIAHLCTLKATRILGLEKKTRFNQASTSEHFCLF